MKDTMSEDDDSGKEILAITEKIIEGAAESESIEKVFIIATKVGSWMVAFRKFLVDGGFSDEFAEDICTMLFQKFFPPPVGGWTPDYQAEEE